MESHYKKRDADHPWSYSLNVKKALVAVLFCANVIVLLAPGVEVRVDEVTPPDIVIKVENIPVTRQAKRTPPPPRPTIPVPSDDETIPEDMTIEETTLKYTNIYDDTPDGIAGITGVPVTPPKPVAWVFPEYPESEKKKGVEGIVRLSIHVDPSGKVVEVVVIDNSTGSEKCAEAARLAAFGSRFYPAREGREPVDFWITQPYRFDLRQ